MPLKGNCSIHQAADHAPATFMLISSPLPEAKIVSVEVDQSVGATSSRLSVAVDPDLLSDVEKGA